MSQAQAVDAPTTAIDSFSAGLWGLSMNKGPLSDVGSDITMKSSTCRMSSCNSIGLLQDVDLENTESQVHQERRDEAEPEAPESVADQSTSMLSDMQEHTEVSDEENEQLLISEYAQQLTEEILRHSLARSADSQHKDDKSFLRGMTMAALCEQLPTMQEGEDSQTDTTEVLQDRPQSRPPTSNAVAGFSLAQSTDGQHGGRSNPLCGLTVASLSKEIPAELEGDSKMHAAGVVLEQLQNRASIEASVQTIAREVDSALTRTELATELKPCSSRLEGETKLASANSSSSCLGGERSSKENCGSPEPSLLSSRKSEPGVHKSSSTIFIDLVKLQENLED